MTSITTSMQTLSLDSESGSSATTPAPPQDDSQADPKPQTREIQKPRRHSRPGQVNASPLPPMDEWLQVKATNHRMYYGFYADEDMLQRMLASQYPPLMERESNDIFLYPALLYLRSIYGRNEIGLNVGILPQRAKDLNPSIRVEVGEYVLVLCLFELEEESFFNRVTQKEVNDIGKTMGMKPTWWHITYVMSNI